MDRRLQILHNWHPMLLLKVCITEFMCAVPMHIDEIMFAMPMYVNVQMCISILFGDIKALIIIKKNRLQRLDMVGKKAAKS